jgi:hypothetical protein
MIFSLRLGIRKNSRVTIATGSTMVLDSSGPATVSAGWLWEMRSAIVVRVRDRNPMEIADDLGHRFWRLSGRRRRACALASVRLSNCTYGFPVCSFHEDT